jgi:hypothetical protein
MIDVSRHLTWSDRTGATAPMLRLSRTAGMYTRLFGPALWPCALAPIVC